MFAPHARISHFRFSLSKTSRTVRVLALILAVAVAAMALGTTSSSAGTFGQVLLARAAAMMGVNATAGTHALDSENAIEPEGSSLATERRGHTATRLQDGRVLVAGGENSTGALNGTEVFDPAAGTFSAAGNMSSARVDHTATLLSDGRVLIAGGRNSDGALATTEIFDPSTGTFAGGASLSVARAGHSATLFADGRIFIAGGDANGSAEIIDSALSGSVEAGNMNAVRSLHSAALLQDGRVLLVGGNDANGNALRSVEVFDASVSSYTNAPGELAVTRIRPHLRVLFDGKVQIIGGNSDVSLEMYQPSNGEIGAYVHLLPDTDTCTGLRTGVRDSQSRAALFFSGAADPVYNRTGHTITELPGSNQALVVGGQNNAGNALNSSSVFASSPASITTDKIDYAPGETVSFSGRGWQPGETVRVVIHEDPHTHLERNFEAVADESGNIAGSYLVEEHDLFVRFIVGARGLTSGFAAQTAFSDGINTVNILSPTAGSPALVTTLPANVPVQFSYNTNGSGGIITFTINIRNGATIVGQTNGTLARSNGGTTTVTFPVNIPAGTPNGLHAVDVILSNPGGTGSPTTRSDTENNAVNINAAVNTSLILAAPSPSSVPFGSSGPVTLSATLIRQIGGASVGGATITFRVDGAPVGTAVTNASGVATLSYNPSNLSFGGHSIQATFAGQTITGTTYVGSSSNIQSFNVTAASTTTALHNWSELSPTGTGPSTSTCAPSTVADDNGRLIVFARTGCGSGGNEVWVLNGADGLGGPPSWTLVAAGGPPGRHAQTAAYDPIGNKLMVFAGCAGGCLPTLNDVWVLSNANGQGGPAVWTQLTPSGAPPAARNHAAGAYDPASNQLIIFGGQNGSGVVAGQTFADVWVLSNANGTGGTPAWAQLTTSGIFPLGQYQARAFYDSNTNRFTVAGGARSDTGAASSAVNVLTNANGIGGTPTWTNLIAEGAPGAPAFTGWAAAYDPANKRGILAEQSTSNLYVLANPNGLGGATAYKQLTPRNGIGLVPTTGLGIDRTTSRIMTLYQNPGNESYVLEPDLADSSSFGDPVTFTAKIDVSAPGAGSPSGSVIFFDGVSVIGGGTVTGGFASFTTSTLTPGVHNITAQFNSSFPGFTGSTSAVLVHTVNKVATTTTLESSLNPSTFGDSVTFTSTTQAGSTPVNEGSVTFIEGGTCAAPGTILAGPTPVGTTGPTMGQALFSTSALTAGGHTITACYTATTHADSEGSVLQTVNKRDTLTTVSSSLNPSTFGESVTFSATVVGTGAGAGDPSGGSVQFKIDGVDFGASVPLVAGSASSGAISSLTAGSHTVEAFFTSADTNFNDSNDSLDGGQTVNKRNTLTTVSSSLNPSTFGESVTFSAAVVGTGAGAGDPSGGSVQFKIDGATFGAPVALAGGSASSAAISSLTAGSHTVEAFFTSADANFNDSNDSLDGGQTVNKRNTLTTVSSSLNPSTFGESVTFSATVVGTGAGAGNPSGGSVQFKIDGANFGAPVALAGGSASSAAISSLTAGSHTVEAFFTSADTNFNDSNDSLDGGQTVNKRNTLTTVSSSLNPSTFGESVTFTATVVGTGAGAGDPSGGSVQFKIDGANFGAPVTLSAGSATSNSINSLNAGNHTVEAVFTSSDTNFSNSNDLLDGGQTVNKASLTVTASSHTITFNDAVPTITASYTGFVVGDDPTDLTVQPTCSTTYTVGSLVGTYPTKCENAVSGNYNFIYVNGTVTVLTACSAFNGFLPPIGGAVELGNGGSFGDPVRAFKLNSTIPVKFNAVCFGVPLTTGIHTLQAIKYSNATDSDTPIDATPTDAATTGNQFRLTGTEWHFNMSTKGLGNNGQGTWLLRATLFDGSSYTVWVSVKK